MRWPDKARVDAPGRARRVRAHLAAAATLAASLLLVLPSVVAAASPAPSQPAVGDPRSSGQGPGLVGDPLTAVIVVVAIAVLTIAVTMAYVRATGGDRSDSG